jgi:hypothetical protein
VLVTIRQSGGITAAIRTLGPVDTSRLDPSAANRVRAAIVSVDWEHAAGRALPDVETRTLVVEEHGVRQEVCWRNDGSTPAWALVVLAAVEVVAVWA